MALHKRSPPPPKVPFPGESPTVSLAIAAGQMYGLNETEEQVPKPKAAKAGKKDRPSRTPAATRKSTAKTKSAAKSK